MKQNNKVKDWKPPTNLPRNWSVDYCGFDAARYRSRSGLVCILSCSIERDQKAWVHLSVSRKNFLPSWEDLVLVKEIFLGQDSAAIQVLPPKKEWVNIHPFCLHLYQCLEDENPIPDFRKFGTI